MDVLDDNKKNIFEIALYQNDYEMIKTLIELDDEFVNK